MKQKITKKQIKNFKDISKAKISNAKLTAVFAPKELEAVISQGKGEPTVRQYLYRARKKYDKFEELFEIQFMI